MRKSWEVDVSDFVQKMDKLKLTESKLFGIIGAGALTVASSQKLLCPVDTGDTRSSISPHWITMQSAYMEVEVGPETEYSPSIEFGMESEPNYPAQPFVVPSATGRRKAKALRAMGQAFKQVIQEL